MRIRPWLAVLLLGTASAQAPETPPPAKYGVVGSQPAPASVESPRLRMDTTLSLPGDADQSQNGDGSPAPADAAALEAPEPKKEKPEEK